MIKRVDDLVEALKQSAEIVGPEIDTAMNVLSTQPYKQVQGIMSRLIAEKGESS